MLQALFFHAAAGKVGGDGANRFDGGLFGHKAGHEGVGEGRHGGVAMWIDW